MALNKMRTVSAECSMNAVIYARYSSDKQTDNSIDFQLRAGQAYCEAKGLKLVGEYIDRAISGTTDNRPEFQRMIKDAKKRQFAYIIVYRFDRFARNRYDSAIYKKELENYGVRVLSTEESIGTGDEGIILESIYEAMAESYSCRLSRVVTQGLNETALKGLSTGGNISLGFKIVDHKVEIDEKNISAIRYCYEARAEGITKKPIADELNSRGYRTKTGKLFTINTVTKILSNPMYKGVHNYNGIERGCPAIIEADLWERVQEIEKREKRIFGKKVAEMYYALSGKLFCGYCSSAMIGDSATSRTKEKHYYYTCSQKKRTHTCDKKREKKDFIEWYICEQTVNYVLTDSNIKRIAERVVALSEEELGADTIAKLEKQLSDIEREIDAAADALIKTNSPAIIKRINEKAEILEAQQNAVSKELAQLRIQQELRVTEKEVASYLNTFRTGDLLDEEFRHRLIKTLINCVYLFDDKMVIYFNVSGMKEVTYFDMLNEVDQLDNSAALGGSDRLPDGPPEKST